jgi:hypothetical protein
MLVGGEHDGYHKKRENCCYAYEAENVPNRSCPFIDVENVEEEARDCQSARKYVCISSKSGRQSVIKGFPESHLLAVKGDDDSIQI